MKAFSHFLYGFTFHSLLVYEKGLKYTQRPGLCAITAQQTVVYLHIINYEMHKDGMELEQLSFGS